MVGYKARFLGGEAPYEAIFDEFYVYMNTGAEKVRECTVESYGEAIEIIKEASEKTSFVEEMVGKGLFEKNEYCLLFSDQFPNGAWNPLAIDDYVLGLYKSSEGPDWPKEASLHKVPKKYRRIDGFSPAAHYNNWVWYQKYLDERATKSACKILPDSIGFAIGGMAAIATLETLGRYKDVSVERSILGNTLSNVGRGLTAEIDKLLEEDEKYYYAVPL